MSEDRIYSMLFNTTSTLLCVSSSTETIHLFKLSHPGPSSEGSISPLSPNRKELPAPQIKENAQKKERNWKAKVYNKEQTLMSKKNRYLSNPSQSILACRWSQVHYKHHQQCRRTKDHVQLTSTVSLTFLPLPWINQYWKRKNCHRWSQPSPVVCCCSLQPRSWVARNWLQPPAPDWALVFWSKRSLVLVPTFRWRPWEGIPQPLLRHYFRRSGTSAGAFPLVFRYAF